MGEGKVPGGERGSAVTLRELLREGAFRLREALVPDPDYDARQLLFHSFSLDAPAYLMKSSAELSSLYPDEGEREERTADFRRLLSERASRIPLQQLLGYTDFFGLRFRVSEAVLSPRQDTEILVEEALAESAGKHALDLCTGSGCVGISLLYYGEFKSMLLTDLSAPALRKAEENAERLLPPEKRARLSLLRSDLFQRISEYEREKGIQGFDLILSNPPYIRRGEIESLEPEVSEHEPRMALDGGEDGLFFYREIAREAPKHLRPGGRICLEIGFDEAEEVSALLLFSGFSELSLRRDLSGNDRVLSGIFRG